ncbi:hypothetical protein BY996DRAFT_8693574, partial [Phakopsora pachyrhizi]
MQDDNLVQKYKPLSDLTIPEIKSFLLEKKIPFKHSFRRKELVQLYNRLVYFSNDVNAADHSTKFTKRKNKEDDDNIFTVPQLKEFLKNNGIKFRANASHLSLVKLYEDHIAQGDSNCRKCLRYNSPTTKDPSSSFKNENSKEKAPHKIDTIIVEPPSEERITRAPKVSYLAHPTVEGLALINNFLELSPNTVQNNQEKPLLPHSSSKNIQLLPSLSSSSIDSVPYVTLRSLAVKTTVGANLPNHEAPISGPSTLQAEEFSPTSPRVPAIANQHHHHAQSVEQSQSQEDTVGVGENGQQGQALVGSEIISSKKVRWSLPEIKPGPPYSTSECPSSSSQDVSADKSKSKSSKSNVLDSSSTGPYCLSIDHLKEFLGRAGIKYQKNSRQATLAKIYQNYIKEQKSLNANIGIALLKDNIKAGKDTKALEISQFEGFPQNSPNQDDSILHQPSVKEGFGKPPKVVALPTAEDLVFINDVPEVNPITCPISQDESTQPLLSPGSSASNKTAKVLPRISDPRTNISANLPHHEAPISGLSTLQSEDFSTSSPHVITHQHQHHAQSDEQSQSKGDTVGVGENGQQGQTTVGSDIVLSKKVQCSLPETKPPPSCSTSECPSSSSQDVSGKKQRSLGPTTSIALSKNDIKALKGIKRFGALPLEEVIASKDEGSKQSEVLIEDDQTTKNPTILKAFQKSNSCLDSPNQDDSILHQPSVKEGFRKPPKVTIVALPTAKDLVFINDVPEVNPITCPLSQDESTQPLLSPGSSASNKTAKVWPRISDPRTNISANLPHHEAPISGLSTLQSEDCFSTIKSPASAIDQSHDKAFQGPNSGVENLDTISKAAKITHSTDGSLSNLVRRREPKYTRFDLSGLDVGRLKYLLKKAGINYQADSRHSTLSKLYKLFLAKQHSKNSDSNKHPRIELPQSLNPSNLSQQSIPVPLSCPVASSSMIPPSEIQTFDEFNQPISNIQGISENTQSFSPLLSTMRDLEEFNWPRPSLLSVDEIKTYLKNNNVEFNDDDNFETLAKCYRSMVVTLQSCYPFKKRCLNWNSAKQPRYCQTCSKLKRLGRKSNNDFNFCATPNESLLNKVCSTPYQSASTSITLVPSPQQPLNKTICADAQQQLGMQALNSINMPFDQPSTAKSSLESYSCITSERILSKNDVLDSEKEEDILATRICSSKGKAHKYPVIYETETEIDDECPSRESTRMFIPSQSASSNTKPLISGSKKGKLTENQLMSNNISELKSSKFQFSRQEYQSDDEQLVNIKNN